VWRKSNGLCISVALLDPEGVAISRKAVPHQLAFRFGMMRIHNIRTIY
jgi:hypothetical protein